MQRTLLKSKIHRATVTGADLHYEGSVTVDRELLEAADIRENEQVQIYSVTSGARLTTYAIAGEAGGGEVRINGAAAHLVGEGETVIIASYALYTEAEAAVHEPRVIRVDERNRLQCAHPHLPAAGAPLRGARAALTAREIDT